MDGVQAYYAREAEALGERYERLAFEDVHAAVLPYLPSLPGRAADIGAGTGRDAAALSRLGFDVVAVEPVPQLRAVARRLHPEAAVRWAAGALPLLPGLAGLFDLLWLSAVWMHLDAAERRTAMDRLAGLAGPGGRIVVSLRHGPLPADRRMFDVSAEETVALAARAGLRAVHIGRGADLMERDDIRWSELVLERPAAAR